MRPNQFGVVWVIWPTCCLNERLEYGDVFRWEQKLKSIYLLVNFSNLSQGMLFSSNLNWIHTVLDWFDLVFCWVRCLGLTWKLETWNYKNNSIWFQILCEVKSSVFFLFRCWLQVLYNRLASQWLQSFEPASAYWEMDYDAWNCASAVWEACMKTKYGGEQSELTKLEYWVLKVL